MVATSGTTEKTRPHNAPAAVGMAPVAGLFSAPGIWVRTIMHLVNSSCTEFTFFVEIKANTKQFKYLFQEIRGCVIERD